MTINRVNQISKQISKRKIHLLLFIEKQNATATITENKLDFQEWCLSVLVLWLMVMWFLSGFLSVDIWLLWSSGWTYCPK